MGIGGGAPRMQPDLHATWSFTSSLVLPKCLCLCSVPLPGLSTIPAEAPALQPTPGVSILGGRYHHFLSFSRQKMDQVRDMTSRRSHHKLSGWEMAFLFLLLGVIFLIFFSYRSSVSFFFFFFFLFFKF